MKQMLVVMKFQISNEIPKFSAPATKKKSERAQSAAPATKNNHTVLKVLCLPRKKQYPVQNALMTKNLVHGSIRHYAPQPQSSLT